MVRTCKSLKYFSLWVLAGLVFLGSGATSFADSARARLTLGLSTLPLKVSGLENIHLSDRKLGSPDATTENRLRSILRKTTPLLSLHRA